MRMWNKASLERTWFIYRIKLWSWLLLSFISIICLFQAAAWFPLWCQEGIMPLFLFRSAIARRLWLDTRFLLASFLRRSSTVSKVWPCPLGLPTTLLGRSGRKLENRRDSVLTNWEPSLPMVPPWSNSRPAVCFAVATEWTNSWLNLPLPLLHGSSSSFSSLSQQSWVLHKLVPVYIILKQKQWIRHHVWVTKIKSVLRNWSLQNELPTLHICSFEKNLGKVLFSFEWGQYRYRLLLIFFLFIILYLVSFPQHLRYCEWSVEPRR